MIIFLYWTLHINITLDVKERQCNLCNMLKSIVLIFLQVKEELNLSYRWFTSIWPALHGAHQRQLAHNGHFSPSFPRPQLLHSKQQQLLHQLLRQLPQLRFLLTSRKWQLWLRLRRPPVTILFGLATERLRQLRRLRQSNPHLVKVSFIPIWSS